MVTKEQAQGGCQRGRGGEQTLTQAHASVTLQTRPGAVPKPTRPRLHPDPVREGPGAESALVPDPTAAHRREGEHSSAPYEAPKASGTGSGVYFQAAPRPQKGTFARQGCDCSPCSVSIPEGGRRSRVGRRTQSCPLGAQGTMPLSAPFISCPGLRHGHLLGHQLFQVTGYTFAGPWATCPEASEGMSWEKVTWRTLGSPFLFFLLKHCLPKSLSYPDWAVTCDPLSQKLGSPALPHGQRKWPTCKTWAVTPPAHASS